LLFSVTSNQTPAAAAHVEIFHLPFGSVSLPTPAISFLPPPSLRVSAAPAQKKHVAEITLKKIQITAVKYVMHGQIPQMKTAQDRDYLIVQGTIVRRMLILVDTDRPVSGTETGPIEKITA